MSAVIGLLAGAAAILGAGTLVRKMDKRIQSREDALKRTLRQSGPASSRVHGDAGSSEQNSASKDQSNHDGRVIGVTVFTWDTDERRITGIARHKDANACQRGAEASYIEVKT
jgi:hypothetical protein